MLHPVEPEKIGAFFADFANSGFVGCNVTVPHKEAAFAAVARRDAAATATGALNTLWLEDGVLVGASTDPVGFLSNLDEEAPGWDATPGAAVVLGAGGSARAIVWALLSRGFAPVHVVNRDPARPKALAKLFGDHVKPARWPDVPSLLIGARVLVNTTTLGMEGQPPLRIDLAPLPNDAVVNDIVYVPSVTELIANARSRKLRTVGGLGMLLQPGGAGLRALVWAAAHGDAGTPRRRAEVDRRRLTAMLVLGVTGSLAMGKSTVAAMFAELGAAVWNADAAVHALYAGDAVAPIGAAFPGVVQRGVVDRAALGAASRAMRRRWRSSRRSCIHWCARRRMIFRAKVAAAGRRVIILDVPLLLETGGERRVDAVVVASAPAEIQRARIAKRGMDAARAAALMARQMSDADKRARAHFIVDTSGEMDATRRQVRDVMRAVAGRIGA